MDFKAIGKDTKITGTRGGRTSIINLKSIFAYNIVNFLLSFYLS